MKKSAVTRIVIYSLLTVLLLALLGGALCFHRNWGLGGLVVFDEDDDLAVNFKATQAGEEISIPANDVQDIHVEWIAGKVTVVPGDVDSIRIQESGSGKPMIYAVQNGKLEIRFNENMRKINIGINANVDHKDLTVTVPADWAGQELAMDVVSADAEIRDLKLDGVEFQGVSGKFDLMDCVIGELDMDTVSGKVTVNGQVREVDCDSVSADCELTLTNVPRQIEMDGVSGDLELYLPENAGFSVDLDGISKDLETDFSVSRIDGRYTCGDESCKIDIDGVSGNARIFKNK